LQYLYYYTISNQVCCFQFYSQEYGFEELYAGYGFGNPAQKAILSAGFNFHICMDLILDILRPIVTALLSTTWLQTHPANPNSLEAIKQWIAHRSAGSETFSSFAEITLQGMGSVEVRRKGIRRNLKAMNEGGTKEELIYMTVTNRVAYSKARLRDLQEYGIRAPDEVRADHRRNFTFGDFSSNKEGIDFFIEGSINHQKPQMTSSSPSGMQAASAMSSLGSNLRNATYREAGAPIPTDKAERSRPIIEETIKRCEGLLAGLPNPFAVEVRREGEDADMVTALDGRRLPRTSSMKYLRKIGLENIEEYCKKKRPFTRIRLQCQGDKVTGSEESDDEDSELSSAFEGFVADEADESEAVRTADLGEDET
jgi:hypothetical protein